MKQSGRVGTATSIQRVCAALTTTSTSIQWLLNDHLDVAVLLLAPHRGRDWEASLTPASSTVLLARPGDNRETCPIASCRRTMDTTAPLSDAPFFSRQMI